VPGQFVVLDAWPLTPNGKIDRNALPDPEQNRPALDVGYAAPETEVEQALAGIWQEVLRVERVGTDDNFFDLGGHSLLMLQVHDKVQKLLKKELPIVELFQYPTVKAMAGLLTREPDEASFEGAQERARRQKEALAQQRQRSRGRHSAP
jgi:acyl carrier protein